ncbi:MAG TPA: hypothetical protein VHG32_12185 [Thermoanaerobaculia bacterium]|nr:hypothetical protein [Thermoanaerobaculia bacterium]
MNHRNLRTVRQLAAETPLTEAAWRWLLYRRKDNGLDAAVVCVGSRVLLDVERVSEWLEARREVRAAPGGDGQMEETLMVQTPNAP